jgi:DNA-binding NarL/FixJ family response regulator
MRFLLIEDHPYKQAKVLEFLYEFFPDTEVITKNSYNSGLKELKESGQSYDLVLLDISMPNYDISDKENGGDFLPFAGRLILKEMYLREIPTKAIVVTMHGSFEDGTKMIDLDSQFKEDFAENYTGYVHFSAANTVWREQLEQLINKFKK